MASKLDDTKEIMLPPEFEHRMHKMLGAEYEQFEKSLRESPFSALRINTLKADPQILRKQLPFPVRPVPWAQDGYYYGPDDKPGRHPYHDAGVYYIQEPSAMAPAEYLEAAPGERILDLCAAPGGKSTQLAAKMKGQGILICNEIHPARAKILSENIERMGIANAVVTNETPERLAEFFAGYFDRILVDAPCSGEGMFRKKEEAKAEWSLKNVTMCAGRQDAILGCAAGMLRPGGRLVYSTCTFAPEENEGSISRFVERFPEFSILQVKSVSGMAPGRADWTIEAAEHIEDTIRLFPHKVAGEGHFVAVLQKAGAPGGFGFASAAEEVGIPEQDCKEWHTFREENLCIKQEGVYLAFGAQLYLAPRHMPSIRGLKVLRPGLHLGTDKKNRFEPSHALALFLHKGEACRTVNLSAGDPLLLAYLGGQSIASEGEKGYSLVLADDYSIGWGKRSGGILKNHYPKGLRRR